MFRSKIKNQKNLVDTKISSNLQISINENTWRKIQRQQDTTFNLVSHNAEGERPA